MQECVYVLCTASELAHQVLARLLHLL
jgi:hypothetical protein